MATVNRRTTHDFVRLEITWDTTVKLHITWDRAGERITHSQHIDHELAGKILALAQVKERFSIGEWIEQVWQLAAGTSDPLQLLALMRNFPQAPEQKRIEHQPSARVKFKRRPPDDAT